MRLSIPQYAAALLDLERGASAETVPAIGARFSAWLNRRGEGKKLGKIVAEAERIVREASDIMAVTITTREVADASAQADLRARAEAIFPGKTIEARFVTDALVIGGVKFRSDGLLHDATLATSVRKLRESLTR